MSATPNETARRMLSADDARRILADERAKRAAAGRPTPPADPQARWIDLPPGTRVQDEAKVDRKRRYERARWQGVPTWTVPRIETPDPHTCGNCGEGTRKSHKGRCGRCYEYYRKHGVEWHVTPRYGASKL